jgi:hypothetical protein
MKPRTRSALASLLLGAAALAAGAKAAPPAAPTTVPADTPAPAATAAPVPCTTPPCLEPPTSTTPPPPAAGSNVVGDVVSGPFKDLNLMKKDIPPVLVALGGQPYLPPADGTCLGLAAEVLALDAALGPDLDALAQAGQQSRNSAAKALTQASHSLVPYRSWIRKLSGAERRAERLAAALLTGTARRAFLKGLGAAQGCEPPASPLPRAPVESPERASGAGADQAPRRGLAGTP